MKIIKKYRNRKLYDSQKRSYITLNEIRDLVKTGAEFVVVDHASQKDVTNDTLIQTILQAEKTAQKPMSSVLLRKIIAYQGV